MPLRRSSRQDGVWYPYQGGGVPVEAFTLGFTKPVSGNVGVGIVTAAPTNTYNGDILITNANTVIENLIVNGRILVRASGVTIRNCVVRGGAAVSSGNTALIDCNHSAANNVLVEFCRLVPQNPSVYVNGMIGHDYTVRRTETHSVVDGFGVYNVTNSNGAANVVIESSWVHDLYYYSPDPNHGDNRTHNDGIQIQGNSNIRIEGSSIEASASSTVGNSYPGASPAPVATNPYHPSVTGQAIGFTPNVGPITNVIVLNNWINFGAQSITAIPGSFSTAGVAGEIKGNRFGTGQPTIGGTRRVIRVHPSLNFTNMVTSTGPDTNGNVDEITGLPVTVYRIA